MDITQYSHVHVCQTFFSEVKLVNVVETHYNTKKLKWWPCQTKRTPKMKWLAEPNPTVCVIDITNNAVPLSKYIFYCYDNLILSGEFLLRNHWSMYLFELLMSFGWILIGPCDIHLGRFEQVLVISLYQSIQLASYLLDWNMVEQDSQRNTDCWCWWTTQVSDPINLDLREL